MAAENIVGKEVLIKKIPMVIYSMFADLRHLTMALPQDMKEKVVVDADSILAEVQGFKIGVKIEERVPFSLISLKDNGQAPFPFKFSFHLEAVGLDSTLFHIELSAELNTMMKMMMGGKLQEAVDKMTDQIEKALSGQSIDFSAVKSTEFYN